MNEFITSMKAKHYFASLKENFEIKKILPQLLLFGILLFIFLANGVHESYPDEFDNILGGWNIIQGNPLYSKFFTHHGPTAYFIAAFVELFSGNSFFRFRLVYSVLLLCFFGFSYWYFRKSVGISYSRFLPLYFITIGIGATYFWGHMLLADNISGIFLSFVAGLLIVKHLNNKQISQSDLVFISILTFFSILSSLTYLYLVIALYGFVMYEYFLSNKLSFTKIKNYVYPFAAFSIPYAVLLIYLLVTGSLGDYLYQNFVFNQKYYIYNYPRLPGETFINPVRFAIIIAHSFLMSFSDLMIQVKDFNFNFPFNITLAVTNTAFLIYLFARRKFRLLIFIILFLIYANGRSDPLTSGERDYQSAVYIFTSLLIGAFLIYQLIEELNSGVAYAKKLIYSFILIVLLIYSFANFSFLARKFMDKTFQKYMGNAPLIYDRPHIAPIMNSVLSQTDYTWIGPFEFEELFYTKIKNASQYQIFNPGMGRSDKIQDGLIADFEKNKPKLIWFDKKFYILGENPEKYGQKFISYINSHYFTLLNYRNGDLKYVSVKPIDQKTDIETKLYIRNENADEVLTKLVRSGIIREIKAQ